MKTKRMFLLIAAAAVGLTTTVASAPMRGSPMMARSGMTRSTPRFATRTTMGTHRFFNDRFHHFRHSHNRTFIFVDAFGFPFFYPYYGYYPYDYYGYYGDNDYGYGNAASRVAEVQRLLAGAGYYHGPIDGIMGPQTRRAIRAYERDHNMPAYG